MLARLHPGLATRQARRCALQALAPRTGLEPATRWLTAYWKPNDDFIGFCCLEKDFSGAIGPETDGDPSCRRFTLSCAG